jgi:hypothetical protein
MLACPTSKLIICAATATATATATAKRTKYLSEPHRLSI